MELDIKIKKTLPGFTLDIELFCETGVTGILGESGSGKSMLLNCVAGLVKPDKGHIRMGGRTLFDSGKKINLPPGERRVGFLFQNYALFSHMTVLENVAFGESGAKKKEKREKASALLRRFHLLEMANRYPAQISGGQQQRVALARALFFEPEVFLLDEPFSALDHHLKTQMMKDMSGMLKGYGGSALFVTHNIDEAYQLCDQIAVINDGEVETYGAKEDVFDRPGSKKSALITGCRNIGAAMRISEHVLDVRQWGIQLQTVEEITETEGFAGVRPADIRLAEGKESENTHIAWIVDEIDVSPSVCAVYLKFGEPPTDRDDFHVSWNMDRQKRGEISDVSKPIRVCIPPERVSVLRR